MKNILYTLFTLFLISSCTTETVRDAKQETSHPKIYPDYVDVTIPVNIAPLNFCMADEKALLIDAVVADNQGNSLHSQGDESLNFDIDDWHQILDNNRGKKLTVTVSKNMKMVGTPIVLSPSSSAMTVLTMASVTAL